MFGSWQKFNGVTRPFKDAKPGWKVLRVLANMLNVPGFTYENIDEVRAELNELGDTKNLLSNEVQVDTKIVIENPNLNGLVRFGLQGIYFSDSIVRRASSLQDTYFAKLPVLEISSTLAKSLDIIDGAMVDVNQAQKSAKFTAKVNDMLSDKLVLFRADKSTCGFAGRYDQIEIKRI